MRQRDPSFLSWFTLTMLATVTLDQGQSQGQRMQSRSPTRIVGILFPGWSQIPSGSTLAWSGRQVLELSFEPHTLVWDVDILNSRLMLFPKSYLLLWTQYLASIMLPSFIFIVIFNPYKDATIIIIPVLYMVDDKLGHIK